MKKLLPFVFVALLVLVLAILAVKYFDASSDEQPVVNAAEPTVDIIMVPEPTVDLIFVPEQEDVIVAGAEFFPTKIMVQVCGPYMNVWSDAGWSFGQDEVDVSQPLPATNTFYPDPNMSCGPDVMGLVAEGVPGSQVPTGGAEHITVIVFDGDEIRYHNYP